MSVDLSGMALFVGIVEHGSLSAAGRALGRSKATVSRELALLERRLGAPLLYRSTRALTLTDMGRRYLDRVRPIVRDAEMAQAEAMAQHATPSGLLRVTAAVAYGQHVVGPKIVQFLQRHRAVRIDLRLSDDRVSLIAGGFDLAIRLGRLDDSELIGQRLDTVNLAILAAPSYLATVTPPQTPSELPHHRAVITRPELDHWTVGGLTLRMPWCLSTGNMLMTRDAIDAGLGIGMLPAFLADEGIASGRLIRLLPDYSVPSAEVTALRLRTVAPSVALTALMAALAPA